MPARLLAVLLIGLSACRAPPTARSPDRGGSGDDLPCDTDLDHDGYLAPACGGLDCDDANQRVRPFAVETCGDGVDDDCDGDVDEGCVCTPGDRRWCLPPGGTEAARTVGACSDGVELCDDGRSWGVCGGGVVPQVEPELCDGIDQDCDGQVDEAQDCVPDRPEICGNGLDDDGDGEIDPPAWCSASCADADPVEMACCFQDGDGASVDRPVPHTFRCMESALLPPCEVRECLDLDGDPRTACGKACDAGGCTCGEIGAAGAPVRSEHCGFATPCARLDCDRRSNQPCYTGPIATLGKGICHGGLTSCAADRAGLVAWGECEGEQLPLPEICGNGIDDDCDGQLDEADGTTGARCVPVAVCTPSAERCNGQDDDCDGFVDETCVPIASEQVCYAGPPATRGVGACRDGVQRAEGGWWGPCNSVNPAPETCADRIDSDCDGFGGPGTDEDAGCCTPSGPEVCNGQDDDCNGLVDDGVMNACGTCDETCHVEEFHEPASCLEGNGRICDRIIPDENNPDAFTMATDRRWFSPSVMYVPAVDRDRLVKLDTLRGVRLWTADLRGARPRHVLVPRDASVWVGGGDVEHLDRDGNLVCVTELEDRVGGMARDTFGDVWAVTAGGVLHRISGWGVAAPGDDGLPRCERYDLAPGAAGDGLPLGLAVEGLAISENHVLWTGSNPAVRMDTNTLALDRVDHAVADGVLLDGNGDAWFGGPDVHRVNAHGPYVHRAAYEAATGVAATALVVDERGHVWGTQGSSLVRIDPVSLTAQTHDAPGPVDGAAVDSANRIWALGGGSGYRFGPWDEPSWATFPIDPGHETTGRGDLTGLSIRSSFQSWIASWTQHYDSGYRVTDWRTLDWQQLRPEGTRVETYVRFADAREALATSSTACGPFTEPPVDLHVCEGAARRRWIAITIQLRSARDGRKPTVGDVQLGWSRR